MWCNSLDYEIDGKFELFYDFLFNKDVLNNISLLDWWKSHFSSNNENVNIEHLYQALHQLLTLRTSSASVERIFCACGLVQSKLRNRLRNDKAA